MLRMYVLDICVLISRSRDPLNIQFKLFNKTKLGSTKRILKCVGVGAKCGADLFLQDIHALFAD